MYSVKTITNGELPADLGTAVCFAAERDGTAVASGEIYERSFLMNVGQLLALRWEAGHVDAAAAIADAALGRATGEVHFTANPHVHPHVEERVDLAYRLGFELWQEKEGFFWTDPGGDLPVPECLRFRSMAEIGPEAYAEIVAAAAVGSLDRLQVDDVAHNTPLGWATEFIKIYSGTDQQQLAGRVRPGRHPGRIRWRRALRERDRHDHAHRCRSGASRQWLRA